MQSLLLALLGGATLHASLTNAYLRYVKAELRPWLIIAGLALIVLAGLTARARRGSAEHEHGHDHTSSPRVAVLLLLPVLVLVVIAPPPLGAFPATNGQTRAPREVTRPLPAQEGPITLDLSEYISSSVYDEGEGLTDREIHLVGFATHRSDGGWNLTRMVMVCCAADAYPVQVLVEGASAPQENTWVEVTGRYSPARKDPNLPSTSGRAWTVVIEADDVQPTPVPDEPYERG